MISQLGWFSVVDPPVDVVSVEPVPDRPVGGRRVRRPVVDRARCGAGEEEAAVGERLRQHRAEVALPDREVPGERVGERQVVLVPVLHRDSRPRPARSRCWSRWHRPGARRPRPGWAARAAGTATAPLRVDPVAVGVGVEVGDLAVAARQPVDQLAPLHLVGHHPEDVVEGVVLHDQHDHVLDLAHRLVARGLVRERAAVGAADPVRAERVCDRARPGRQSRARNHRGTAGGAPQQRPAGDVALKASHPGSYISRDRRPLTSARQ